MKSHIQSSVMAIINILKLQWQQQKQCLEDCF